MPPNSFSYDYRLMDVKDPEWRTNFPLGARVRYRGTFTPSRVGLEGNVVPLSQNGSKNSSTNINVLWDDGEITGSYPYNLEVIYTEPDWRI